MEGKQVRALRGAISVAEDTAEAITAATQELLRALLAANEVTAEEVISALFTVTPDLKSGFPATAARALGWVDVPMLCATEIPVPGSLPRCLRVLLHVYTDRARAELVHVYLGEARALRPDLAEGKEYVRSDEKRSG